MPKPLFLVRPSGLYVRFLVPQDLRDAIGSRFLVRTLSGARGDHARFVAAALATALSEAFARMWTGVHMVGIKKLLESAQQAAQNGSARDWTATNVRVGDVDFGTVFTSGREDTLDFIRALEAAAAIGPVPSSALAAQTAAPPDPQAPLLSEEIAHHLQDLERRKLAPDTITESKHTLRILFGVVGDRPVAQIKREQIRAFWDAVYWWPVNATVKPKYRGLSLKQIVEAGRAEGVSVPSNYTTNKHRQRLGGFSTPSWMPMSFPSRRFGAVGVRSTPPWTLIRVGRSPMPNLPTSSIPSVSCHGPRHHIVFGGRSSAFTQVHASTKSRSYIYG